MTIIRPIIRRRSSARAPRAVRGVAGLPQCRRRPRGKRPFDENPCERFARNGYVDDSVSASDHNRSTEHFVYVLDHDAGLRSVLPEPERARARQHAVAGVHRAADRGLASGDRRRPRPRSSACSCSRVC